ncbi:hypothetical protein MRX96_042074 [Rhipicephalus microplus]
MSSSNAIMTAARAVFLPLVTGVLVAAFSFFPTAERVSRAKDIQMMTGMSGCTYWTSNYLFDVQVYLTVWALMGVLLSFYYVVTTKASGTMLTWKSMVLAAERRQRGEDLVTAECLRVRNGTAATIPTELLGPGFYHCCQMELTNSTDWEPLSPFGFHSGGILPELIIMVIEGLMLFVLLDRLDSGQFFWMPGPPAPAGQGAEASAADDEVRQERKLVEAEVAKGKSAEYAMAARGLGKRYGTTEVVRSVSLALRNNECLGLLGLNGSGKTTTLEMLAALLPPTSGDAFSRGLFMSDDPKEGRVHSGVVGPLEVAVKRGLLPPQRGGLLDQLTSSEFLKLIASLRGVPQRKGRHDRVQPAARRRHR